MSSVTLKFKAKYIENITINALAKEFNDALAQSGLKAMENVFDLSQQTVPFRKYGRLKDSGEISFKPSGNITIISLLYKDVPHFEVKTPVEGEKHTAGLDSPITSWANKETTEDTYIQTGDKNYLSNSFESVPVFDLVSRDVSHTFFK